MSDRSVTKHEHNDDECTGMCRVGDEGQRYVVSVYDENRNERMNLYYTDDPVRAAYLATISETRPSWNFAWVTDRRPGEQS